MNKKKAIMKLLIVVIIMLWISHHYFMLRFHYSEASNFNLLSIIIPMVLMIDITLWIGIIILLILLVIIE